MRLSFGIMTVMKRTLFIAYLLLVLAGTGVAEQTGMITGDRVRVRNKPTTNSETVGHVNKGDKVTILDKTSKKDKIGLMEDYWYKIEFADGKKGWAFGHFVRLDLKAQTTNQVIFEKDFGVFTIVFRENLIKKNYTHSLSNRKMTLFKQDINVYIKTGKKEILIDTLKYQSDDEKPIKEDSITLIKYFSINSKKFYAFKVNHKISHSYLTEKQDIIIYFISDTKGKRVFLEPVYINTRGFYDAGWKKEIYKPYFGIEDINSDNKLDIIIKGKRHYSSGYKEMTHKDNTWNVNNTYYWNGITFIKKYNLPTVNKDYLTISMSGSYKLYHELIDNNFVGFEVDLAKEIANRLAYKLKIINPVKLSTSHNELLQNNKVDFVLSSLTFEQVKGKNCLQYASVPISILTTKDGLIKNYNDLAGKKIAIVKNTETESEFLYILTYNKYVDKKDIKHVSNYNEAKILFINNKVDIIIGDKLILDYFSKDLKNSINIKNTSNHSERYFILFKETNERTKEVITEILGSLKKEGVFDNLKKSWQLLE